MSQVVKYSEDYEQLLNSFEAAPEATIVFGSLNDIQAGTAIAVYVSAPYTTGKSVYFVVETTATNSQKVWWISVLKLRLKTDRFT